jgi:hypothetical protein
MSLQLSRPWRARMALFIAGPYKALSGILAALAGCYGHKENRLKFQPVILFAYFQ